MRTYEGEGEGEEEEGEEEGGVGPPKLFPVIQQR